MNVTMNGNSVTVNNKTINVPKGASVSVVNGQVFVNGKPYENLGKDTTVNLIINGDVGSIITKGPVQCHKVLGDVEAGNYVECGDIGGNVHSGNYVEAQVIKGAVKAGSYIEYNGRD